MTTNKTDCDITLHLEKLFHEYVSLYTKLYLGGGDNSEIPDERIEMALKLESSNQEMSELVMQLQNYQSESEPIDTFPLQTINAAKGNSMQLSAMGAWQ